MSKFSYWVVAYDHDTKTFSKDTDTFEARFEGSIYDDQTNEWYYPDPSTPEAEIDDSAGWDLEQSIEGLNLILIDRDEE